ncbi:FMN-binding protein [Agrococcus sp. SL85]|uniref:FMN-binding protein n=1 Tax=Agrococcus sp. SL85 TaxID=2995141 RepID=UPI00226D051A|nr:FMN-binding protein [Agrococcus sp. SL85]WAC66052.1 FMN-binding protein [Agrococcus sp. SL85]
MKRIIYSLLATATGLVLLLGYRTSTGEAVQVLADQGGAADASASSGTGTSSGTGSGSASGTAQDGTGQAAPSSDASGAAAGSGLADGTYTGDAVQTRYGPVQVAITVCGGTITAVDVPTYPDANSRDRQINEFAVPRLVAATLEAQGDDVQMVSGATFTSRGYEQSLQSALDEARA